MVLRFQETQMKLHGFDAMVIKGRAIYLVAHITVEGGIWLWPGGTQFGDAAYCLN